MYHRQPSVNKLVQSDLIKYHFFSNLLNSQHLGTTITYIKERTGVAVLCCHGKKFLFSYILIDLIFAAMVIYNECF